MEGVRATGVESRYEVAADAAGNARPIEIVSEMGMAVQLEVPVPYRIDDLRTGEAVTALSVIDRNELDAALFEIPAQYLHLTQRSDVTDAK